MDTSQWPQGIGVVEGSSRPPMVERRGAAQKDQVVNCPRCNSTNTKFCYYNNYSLSQPRYFCKTCRRYWTEGGSLRNVPVGGGSRKNKRPSSSSSPSPANSSKKLGRDLIPAQNPKIHESGQDLNLAYPPPNNTSLSTSSTSTSTSTSIHDHHLNTMELLKSRGGLGNSFISMMPISDANNNNNNNAVYASGFPILQDFKPTSSLSFSLVDGFESATAGAYGNLQEVQHENSGGGARLLFPMEELKQQVPMISTTNNNELMVGDQQIDIIRGQGESTTSGYWNVGMLGGTGHW